MIDQLDADDMARLPDCCGSAATPAAPWGKKGKSEDRCRGLLVTICTEGSSNGRTPGSGPEN